MAGRAHRVVERPPAAGDVAVVACRPRGALSRALHAARSPTSFHRRRHSRSGRAHKHAHHVRLDVLRLRGHRLGGSPLCLVQVRSRGCDSRSRARRRAHLPRRHPSRQRRGYVTDTPLDLSSVRRAARPRPARTPLPRPLLFVTSPASSTDDLANVARRGAALVRRGDRDARAGHAAPRPRVRPPATPRTPSERARGPSPHPRLFLPPHPAGWMRRYPLPRKERPGDAPCIFRPRLRALESQEVADPPHPSPGFEQRPRRTSR